MTTIRPIWPSVSFRHVAPLRDHFTVVDHHDRGQVKLSLRISNAERLGRRSDLARHVDVPQRWHLCGLT
jgi:hypothetical protein